MAAGTLNITIEQGADFIRVLTIKDGSVPPQPIDLTGFIFQGAIRAETCDVSATAAFSFTILNQTTNKGQVEWKMPAAITATIPTNCVSATDQNFSATPYLYDVEMITPIQTDRIMRGKVQVIPEVTK